MADLLKITSRDNPVIKFICSLQGSAKARRESGKFVLEGLRICDDAAENGIHFDTLVFTENALNKHPESFKRFSAAADNTIITTEGVFNKISDTDSPQGILAVAEKPKLSLTAGNSGRYIALENLSDPSNLGAVSRTAEALGVSGIVLSGGCDPYSPKALRASMGTLLRMPLFITEDIAEFARLNGLRTVACVVDSTAVPINDVAFRNGDMVIIGNEANGITDNLKQNSDILTTIRMCGRAESLNASIAAAISVWEMMR